MGHCGELSHALWATVLNEAIQYNTEDFHAVGRSAGSDYAQWDVARFCLGAMGCGAGFDFPL
jgi:hypothetical protein